MVIIIPFASILCGVIGYFLARSKGREPVLWAIICGVTWIGIIVLVVLPARSPTISAQSYERSRNFEAPREWPTTRITFPSDSLTKAVTAAHDQQATITFDQKKWAALLTVDADIAAAAEQVRPLGVSYVNELADTYLALNEKSYLPTIVSNILEKAKRASEVKESEEEKLAKEMAAKAENRREFSQAVLEQLRANGGVDELSRKPVDDATVYNGTVRQWIGGLKLMFRDGSIELRLGPHMRAFFSNAEEFAEREARFR